MSADKPRQQLQMLLPEEQLEAPRPISPPDGYVLRQYRPADAAAYIDLLNLAGFKGWDGETLKRVLPGVLPGGLFLAVHHSTQTLAATAMATHHPTDLHPYGGELGWVAGHPEHLGKGLGAVVCAAVARRYAEAGYERVYLKTDDWRLPALKTYLKLGWVPFLYAPDMRDRWRAVCENLEWPFTPDDWPALPGTPASPAQDRLDERPNAYIADHAVRRLWLPNRTHRTYPGGCDMDAFTDESLYRPSLLGTAAVEPRMVEAGGTAALRLTYTAGPAGLPEGTTVHFGIRGQRPLGVLPICGLAESPVGCGIEPFRQGCGFRVTDGCLAEGDSVVLCSEPFEWTPLAGRRELKVVLQSPGDRPEQRLPEPLVIDILPGQSHRLEAVLPCTHRAGDDIDVSVTSRDSHDNRTPSAVELTTEGAVSSGPASLVVGRAAGRVARANGGVVRVRVRSEELGLECESNPSVPADDYQLYVGDLHCHDFLSQAEGYPDLVYRWAMDDRRLDFVSVVPQSHGWHDNQTWTITKYMNERFLDEGRFVTFLGFEWQHTGYGDKVVHYLGGDQPYLPVDDPRYSSPEKIYRLLRDSDATVISHHTGYPPGSWCPQTDFGAVDNDLERVVELWSMHGSSEGYDENDRPLRGRHPGGTAMDALRMGLRLGFVAGSDTHSARPGGSAKEPLGYWGGLAGIWAKDLTRRSLFEAVRARRTYALTRARIVLKMTVNGAMMGSEIPAADRAAIRVRVWAQDNVRSIEIVKNTRLLKSFGPFDKDCELELVDETNGPAFYHCRVTQNDGELAVCSPVWVG